MSTVDLTCWECEREWTVHRRRGQYQRYCASCAERRGGVSVKRLVALALGAGVVARIVQHQRLGSVVMVETPFHDRPVALRDRSDLDWLLVELANTGCHVTGRAA